MKELKTIKVFSADTAEKIKTDLKNIEDKYWVTRTTLGTGRGLPGESCKHDWLGQNKMSKELLDFLTTNAPVFEDFTLEEVCVNRYNEGDYLGKHKDMHMYTKNVVVSLQENGDGLLDCTANKFIEDRIGQGVVFTGVGPLHMVPPVKKERFVVVYLYQ